MWFDVLGFLVCAVIIFFSGKKLSFYGDQIAEVTGMGKAWVGLILMAAVTSLPEMMVGISSSMVLESADLAVGDIIGSCAFNLGILTLMDLFTPKDKPLFQNVSQSHILAASFGIILIGMAGLGIYLNENFVLIPSIGLFALSFAVVYLISVRTIYRYQKVHPQIQPVSTTTTHLSLKKIILMYCFFALIIIVTAFALPHFAEGIAQKTGLGQTFVGTLFLAISTSLPEIAVSLAAVRMGSTDMAVGNLLGSNLFNPFILFLDDIFYTKGYLLKDASDSHIVSIFFVILMSCVAIIGVMFPQKEKKIFMAADTLVIFIFYTINMIILYQLSR
ncbi:MAG: sodium:calcium antiporter [Bacteroidetes bacterium]|nr:MAG: sodium:calcium antiporter [Bacteroidota bacterium]